MKGITIQDSDDDSVGDVATPYAQTIIFPQCTRILTEHRDHSTWPHHVEENTCNWYMMEHCSRGEKSAWKQNHKAGLHLWRHSPTTCISIALSLIPRVTGMTHLGVSASPSAGVARRDKQRRQVILLRQSQATEGRGCAGSQSQPVVTKHSPPTSSLPTRGTCTGRVNIGHGCR